MSARAAWRLQSLGFTQVFRYTNGKRDWFAAGLPCEGNRCIAFSQPGELARRDAPTCRTTELIGVVRDRVRTSGWDVCVVVNDERIVLGLLRDAELNTDPWRIAETVMEEGPRTFRASARVKETLGYMRRHVVDSVLVTTPDGKLLGVLRRDDAERAIEEGQPLE